MATRNLDKIFRPNSVAVVGASGRSKSVGFTALRNLIESGFPGEVYPVNPKHKTIQGLKCVPRITDLAKTPDLAMICTPATTVPEVVRECGEARTRGLIILSAGFREASGEGAELEQEIQREARRFDGMRIIGPNCLGLIAPHAKLNASFAAKMPSPGRVAFISQSGALCTSILDWAIRENVGFSHFISIGNMLDAGFGDLIDYLAQDAWTESILLYIESIDEPREFMSAARAFARKKPIVAYKAGRFAESAKAAASHTGAMAGIDSVYEAALARAGVVRVYDSDDMFDCAELLARRKIPKGPRLAVVTNAGGPGVMATDELIGRKGTLATLSEQTLEDLNKHLPAAWSHANPVDIIGDATPERFSKALGAVIGDHEVDAVLVILTPQAMTDPTAVAEIVAKTASQSYKPVLTSWMGGDDVAQGVQLLNEAGVPTYSSPEKAVRAFMYLVSYARNRELLYETPREVPLEFPLDRGKLRAVFDTILSEGHDILTESTSKALLEAYEIPVAKTFVARSKADAVDLAHRVGYPVVLKVFSPDITHKTDVGGVELNLANQDEVRAAFERIVGRAKEHCPGARVDGVTVQRMVAEPSGQELIIGAKRDLVFGSVLLVGAGGTSAELFHDSALELPPLSERLARRMLESLRSWPLLRGYRGRPGISVDRLIEVLMRFSYLVADYPEIVELDVNPLLVTPQDAIALDARIILDHQTILHPVRPYSHLAIRPYPEEFCKPAKLKDGLPVYLRPIKPEDEPMWHALLSSCSQESIWLRFQYSFKNTTHEMATRFCFIDYDREIAIVAEIEEDEQRKLIGVGRLVADADHQEAEYAVLVGDPWQGVGLGGMLTDYCLEICNRWRVRNVIAEVAPENSRMLATFDHRGFELDRSVSDDVVIARKTLASTVRNNCRVPRHLSRRCRCPPCISVENHISEVSIMKFHIKGFISLLMGCCFLVVAGSGIMMYVTPKGRIANWTDWSLFGLTKPEWSAVHINACLVFLMVSIVHWFLNWKVFWSYIKRKAGSLNLKVEMTVAAVLTIAVVAGTLLQVPPLSTVITWNDTIKAYWAQQAPAGPAPHAEDFSIHRFADTIGISQDNVLSALRKEGYVIADPRMTIAALAEQKGIAPSDVYSAIRRHYPAVGERRNTGQGKGRGIGQRLGQGQRGQETDQ